MFFKPSNKSRPTRRPRLPPLPELVGEGDGQEPFLGCGWFDSSHDLQHGLWAAEWPAEAPLPAALALEICLAG